MAFISLVFVGIILIIFMVPVFLAILFFIMGLVKKKKQKKSANIFFALSGICTIPLMLVVIAIMAPKKELIETPTGTVKVWESTVNKYEKALQKRDLDSLEKLLTEHPELVYYIDINRRGIVEYGMASCDVEIMELGLRYGAEFDAEYIYDGLVYEGSCPLFFDNLGYRYSDTFVGGETTDEILDAVKFMLENGADMERGASSRPPNFLFYAIYWTTEDGKISKKDMELIFYIIDQGCSMDVKDSSNQTARELFADKMFEVEVEDDAFDLVYEFTINY